MALTLYHHPLSSFCWKVSIALYESGIPFEPHLVDLGDEESRRRFLAVWPLGKMPVLQDAETDRIIPETTIILDYLAARFPGAAWLLSGDAETVREIRLRDRFFDLYVQQPMQKIVTDRLRPAGQDDTHGVETARQDVADRARLRGSALDEQRLGGRRGVQHGGLRRRTGAVLRRQGGALPLLPPEHLGLPATRLGAAILRDACWTRRNPSCTFSRRAPRRRRDLTHSALPAKRGTRLSRAACSPRG